MKITDNEFSGLMRGVAGERGVVLTVTLTPEQIVELAGYTPEQVSELTGLSLGTLSNWRSQGRGPAYRKLGRAIRYPAAARSTPWLASCASRALTSGA